MEEVEVVGVEEVVLALASVTRKEGLVVSSSWKEAVPRPLGASRPSPRDVCRDEEKVEGSSVREGRVGGGRLGETLCRVRIEVTVCWISAIESSRDCLVGGRGLSASTGLARTGEKSLVEPWGTAGTGRRNGLLNSWFLTGRLGTAAIGSGRMFWTGASSAADTGWSATVPRNTSASSWRNLFSCGRKLSCCVRNLSSCGRNLSF